MENDELATYLNMLHLDEVCRVDQVLKASDREVTELVSVPAENGSVWGPLVRKRIRADARMGSAYGELFAAQRAGKRFRHLPAIYSVHERDDELIVLMEYVRGTTLHDEVYERDPSLALACERFPALCDGVMEMHGEFSPPLIHRDLKPANVIVNGQGLTIIDFGIARSFRPDASADTAPFATRAYAPPEQFGYGQTDERSDVYALGMVLYFLLTERNPTADLVARGFNEPDVPVALRPVLARACAFDPRFRMQSVRELKDAFLQAVAQPTQPPAGALSPMPQPQQPPMPQQPQLAQLAQPMQPPAGAPAPMPQQPQLAPMPQPQQPSMPQQPAPMPQQPQPPAGASSPMPQPAPYGNMAPSQEKPRPTYEELRNQGWSPTQARKGVLRTLRASEIVGAVWDFLLLSTLVLLTFVCLTIPFNPSPELAKYPTHVLFLAYLGLLAFFAGLTYAAMDKRIFRRFVPFMRKQTFLRGLLVGFLLGAAGLALTVAVVMGYVAAGGA